VAGKFFSIDPNSLHSLSILCGIWDLYSTGAQCLVYGASGQPCTRHTS